MSRYYSYLNSAKTILEAYSGEEPFALYLKDFFKQHKKYGSRDRKIIAALCYEKFRLGKAHKEGTLEDKILAGHFLTNNTDSSLLEIIKPQWNEQITKPIEEKLTIAEIRESEIFPWQNEISAELEFSDFCKSFLIQPDLFLRIRPCNEKRVIEKLQTAGLAYHQDTLTTIRLVNNTKLDDILLIDQEVVIQDKSSQRIAALLAPLKGQVNSVWDACAASGGKSILALDTLGPVDLLVTDIRENILINLKKRFSAAYISKYQIQKTDLSKGSLKTSKKFDLIITDVPCTGCGTWSRTPEQLHFFEENKISTYATLQKSIVQNVLPSLKVGGYLLYITCSVFKKENEEVINELVAQHGLKIIQSEMFRGYHEKADTLFACLLQKL